MTCPMRLPVIAIAAACLLAGPGGISCDGKPQGDRPGAPAEPVGADSVRAYVELREMGYAALEPVPMRLVVRNISARALRLTFPDAQRFDFVISRDRERVWAWSDGRTFAGSQGILSLARGDSLVYDYTWDGKLAGGTLPRLGRYRVRGLLMTRPPVETDERQFGIVD